jgi:penicillin-binding protein 2
MFGLGRRRKLTREIEPDEIFIDSSNLPAFDTDQFEGKIERPIGRQALVVTVGIVALLMLVYAGRAWNLQFINGTAYAKQAAENQLTEKIIFADRGIIEDRAGRELAYNERSGAGDDFAQRVYSAFRGISHVVGYVKPPQKDSSGFYFRAAFEGVAGIERAMGGVLAGQNGITLTETNATGEVVSQSAQVEPTQGSTIRLSIDALITQGLFDAIKGRADGSHFQGGSGVLMDIDTGEIIALTSYPEYSSEALSNGDKDALAALNQDTRQPFLNRAISGLYAPGSIVKPFIAVGALTEGVVDEDKKILSTGSISIPNPYDPAKPSVYKDWRPQGWVDVRQAIAVSSDVYFYEVGGGFEDQQGLGIDNIDKYLRLFGFGNPTGLGGFEEPSGTIPTPQWKLENFGGDPWRVGDTYHTAIGQYGVQVTPLQAARAVASIANGGFLVTPTLIASSTPEKKSLNLSSHILDVVKEGMRLSVTEGTATAVDLPFIKMGGKTGTAQVGVKNEFVNSWIVGFFPYDKPKYAFAIVLERAPAGTLYGAPAAASDFFNWMRDHAPEYFQQQ